MNVWNALLSLCCYVCRNELMGLAGMVKLTNPDENVNFSAPPPVVQLESVMVTANHLDNQDLNKRFCFLFIFVLDMHRYFLRPISLTG